MSAGQEQASIALTVQGHFSDGETRDLTTATGTVYESSDSHIATVDATGRATAVAPGETSPAR